MQVYKAVLNEVPGSDFTQAIAAELLALNFHFRWDDANQEQYDLYARALSDRAAADPLIKGKEIIRDYDWIDYYTNVEEWEDGKEYPQSLKGLVNNPEAMNIQLEERKQEALALGYLLRPLEEQMVWNVEITDANGQVKTGVVRPGGWIGNQDTDWRVQFSSDLENIGYDDLLKTVIRLEIAE